MRDGPAIIVPCPQCGQRLRGRGDRLNQTARCQRGHGFLWNANSLRNPIQAPSKIESTGTLANLGSWLGGIGACGFGLGVLICFNGRGTTQEVGVWMLVVGIALVAIEAVRGQIGRTLAQRRSVRWLGSDEGQRYTLYERDIEAARDGFRRAEEQAQRGVEEKRRRALAENAKKRQYLLELSARDFEQHVADIFAALGYSVTLTPASGDEGVDVYLEKDGRRAIVQCKHFTQGAVSRPDLQQFFGVLIHKAADEGWFVTTTRFSERAIAFARDKRIHLVDLQKLVQMAGDAFTEEFMRSGPSGQMAPRSLRRSRRYWSGGRHQWRR